MSECFFSFRMKVLEEVQYDTVALYSGFPLPFTEIVIFFRSCINFFFSLPHRCYSCSRAQEGVCTGLLWLATRITYLSCGAVGSRLVFTHIPKPRPNRQTDRIKRAFSELSQTLKNTFASLGPLNRDLTPTAFWFKIAGNFLSCGGPIQCDSLHMLPVPLLHDLFTGKYRKALHGLFSGTQKRSHINTTSPSVQCNTSPNERLMFTPASPVTAYSMETDVQQQRRQRQLSSAC